MSTLFQYEPAPKSRIPRLLGYGLALACLVWVLHDFHITRALRELANVNWKWVLVGMAFDVVSYGVQAVRWKLLLVPFGRIRLSRSIRAVYAGLFANLIFPLRPGELLRSYLISSTEEITFGKVLGSVGVERLIDLVIATAGLAVVSLSVGLRLPTRFKRVADALGILTLVLLGLVVLMVLYLEIKMESNAIPVATPRRIQGRAMAALIALHAMGTAPSFYPAVFASILMPFCQILALWAMIKAYGLQLPFLAAVVVLLVINLGVSLPNAPANFGAYQFFCVLGLSAFQVEKTTATGFSFFAFLALTIPFVFLGFLALLRSGLSLRSMREELRRLPAEAQRPVSRSPSTG